MARLDEEHSYGKQRHPDFSSYELGLVHPTIEIDTSAAVSTACCALFSKAARDIVIMSRNLDPVVFDNAETSLALRNFLLGSRHARLRILVNDAESVARCGHRIVELAQRLSSFAKIRAPAAEFRNHNSAYVVVDTTALLYRGLANRYEAIETSCKKPHANSMKCGKHRYPHQAYAECYYETKHELFTNTANCKAFACENVQRGAA
jgi:hypothetical protein